MAQKDIQSVLQEDRVFPPSAAFAQARDAQGRRTASACTTRPPSDYVGFWADLAAAEIEWQRPFTVPLDDSRAPNYRWFTDGQLNVSHNCLDVHLASRGDKVAVDFRRRARRRAQTDLRANCTGGVPVRQCAQGAGHGARRSRGHLHAADSRGGRRHAGLRAHRRRALGGVRRIFRQRRQGSHRGCGRQARHHRRCRMARRPRRRAQGGGRQGACRKAARR